MQIYRVLIACVFLSIVAFNTAAATSPRRYKSELDQRDIKMLIEIHHELYGEYPVSDEQGTWFEKLSESDQNVDYLRSAISNDGKHLLGEYGFPIVFEPPRIANGNQIVIRDVGENGIDDNGLLDDWDSRYGPQMGYWYKKRWPGVYRRACVGVAIAVIGLILIQHKAKGKLAKLAYYCFHFGLLAGLILPWVGSRDRYHDIEMFGIILCVPLLFLGIIFTVAHAITTTRRNQFLDSSGNIPCSKCGYDLRGTIPANIDRCPECGGPVPEDTDIDVDITPPHSE